ncbi:MAG: prepilin-type N-terminal cleavage/methylation domain-containing protein [Planctomycetota bacterium]|jgi:prepilin-type N-terminal cleavage/methylation domain-containing protein
MHKGFTLTEILAALFLMAAAMVAIAPVTSTLFSDIPRSFRVVQSNTRVLDMLGWMREDVDGAQTLPESFDGHASDPNMLLIELSDGVICYQLKDGEVIRYPLADADADSETRTAWDVPNAGIKWQVWRTNGKGYAVEVGTWIDYPVRGRVQKRMANSHVFFVGATGGTAR